MAVITKLIIWLGANGASIIAALQVVLKLIKELLTAVINLVSIILPTETAQKIVDFLRACINMIDKGLEFIKKWLLQQK